MEALEAAVEAETQALHSLRSARDKARYAPRCIEMRHKVFTAPLFTPQAQRILASEARGSLVGAAGTRALHDVYMALLVLGLHLEPLLCTSASRPPERLTFLFLIWQVGAAAENVGDGPDGTADVPATGWAAAAPRCEQT